MAILQVNYRSEILQMEHAFNVVLPQISMMDEVMQKEVKENGLKTLYLLHGLSDDHTAWLRRTPIERYASKYGIAVVMPNVNRSFYADMKYGLPFYSYMVKELPHAVRTYFPLSAKREDNYIAGLSMGGYGAFMIALRNPEMFGAAASLSGALDLVPIYPRADEEIKKLLKLVFGSKKEYINSDYNLIKLVENQVKAEMNLPKLFQCCGTEDFLYPVNAIFRKTAIENGLDLTYEEGPGTHEWGYWDTNIQRVLEWMFG